VSEETYLTKILDKFGMTNLKLVCTRSPKTMNEQKYMDHWFCDVAMVCTRLDIAHVVNLASTFMCELINKLLSGFFVI